MRCRVCVRRDETGEATQKARRRQRKPAKRKFALALANDQLHFSSVRFNDKFLVAGTSLPDRGIEDIANLMIEKTVGVWRRDGLETSLASRRGTWCSSARDKRGCAVRIRA
jgi:hypothetical protein